jgi:hypothetical protein
VHAGLLLRIPASDIMFLPGRYFPVSAKNLTESTAGSLHAHVQSCSRCPEPIKAALAYLGHRSILQKAELSGSWKKSFFQKVWSRLHEEHDWTPVDDDDAGTDLSSENDCDDISMDIDDNDEARLKDDGEESCESDKEEVGPHMNALIKAAAIWLTEQDSTSDTAKKSPVPTKSTKKPPPAVAAASPVSEPVSTGTRGGRPGITSKRRRAHF